METFELFSVFLHPLNRLGLPYMITGAAAAIVYGEPRMTLDLDLVVNIQKADIMPLMAAFPEDQFYLPPDEVLQIESSRTQRGHFNIIHHESGLRADIYLMGKDVLNQWGMKNRKPVKINGEKVWLAPIEYVIVRKLQYFQEGHSEKHILDIRGMLELSKDQVDMDQLELLLKTHQLEETWREIFENDF